MWHTSLLLVYALAMAPSSAMDLAGVRLDDSVTVGGHEIVLNGAGVRTALLLVRIYVGSLYVPRKARDFASVASQSPCRIQLNMLRDLSNDLIVDALADGLRGGNDEATAVAVKSEQDQFMAVIKMAGDVKAGDVVAFDFVDGETRISLNGVIKGAVGGEAFGRALMAVWLGDRIKSDSLKRAMFGN